MQKQLRTLALAGALLCASGCALNRQVTVIDSRTDIVRLGKGVRGPVYTQDADGHWTLKGVVTLPEGWYAGPMEQ